MTMFKYLERLHRFGMSISAKEDMSQKNQREIDSIQNLNRFGLVSRVIPVDETGELLSVGTIPHGLDKCTLCAFWFKGKCHKQEFCLFCHHKDHSSERPKKTRTRAWRFRGGSQAQQLSGEGPEAHSYVYAQAEGVLSSSSGSTKCVVSL